MPSSVPIITLPLFTELDRLLLELLRSLPPDDWQRPTLAREWMVQDVAAHLLDGNLRTLSMLRDGHFGEAPPDPSYAGIVAYLTQLNGDWVRAARRLSPAVLIDLLAQSGTEYTAYLHTLDPWAPAAFSVAWAGESASLNWFHIARDYTEKWHHQQQIRAAVGQTASLLEARFFRPFIETMIRGLPHAYRAMAAPVGTVVQVRVETAGAGWQLVKAAGGWQLLAGEVPARPAAEVVLPAEVAWRLFTKGMSLAEARPLVRIAGDAELAEAALRLVGVMA